VASSVRDRRLTTLDASPVIAVLPCRHLTGPLSWRLVKVLIDRIECLLE